MISGQCHCKGSLSVDSPRMPTRLRYLCQAQTVSHPAVVVGALMELVVMSRKFKESVDLGVVNQGELVTTAASFELS